MSCDARKTLFHPNTTFAAASVGVTARLQIKKGHFSVFRVCHFFRTFIRSKFSHTGQSLPYSTAWNIISSYPINCCPLSGLKEVSPSLRGWLGWGQRNERSLEDTHQRAGHTPVGEGNGIRGSLREPLGGDQGWMRCKAELQSLLLACV